MDACGQGLQPRLAALASDSALDEAVWIALWRVHLSVLASVLEALVPAEVNLEVVLVWKQIVDLLNEWHCSQDLVAHLVHGVLHAGRLVLCKGLGGDLVSSLESWVEFAGLGLDGCERVEGSPCPVCLDFGGQNAIPGLWQSSVFVPVEAIEGRSSALEYKQLVNAALDREAGSFSVHKLDVSCLCAVAKEAVWVRLAINHHASPLVLCDVDVAGVDVRVFANEVVTDDRSEKFWWLDWVLFGEDIAGLLLGIGSDYDGVVGFSVGGLDVTFKENANRHLDYILCAVAIAFDLVQADVVLAITCIAELRHCDMDIWMLKMFVVSVN